MPAVTKRERGEAGLTSDFGGEVDADEAEVEFEFLDGESESDFLFDVECVAGALNEL